MKNNLYTVYDKTARSYSAPMPALNHATAIRTFRGQVNWKDPNNALYNSPQDFSLHHIGEFNTDTGVINECRDEGSPWEPELIIEAAKLKEETK